MRKIKPVSATNARVVERLAHWAFQLHQGDLAGTVQWLESLGCKDPYVGSGDAAVTGITGVRVGLCARDDPITCAVQIGFALAGPHWPKVYPGLLEAVNKQWKQRLRQRKANPVARR